MEKKTIKTRFLAGILAMSMAGSSVSALAIAEKNGYNGKTTAIVETEVDEKTKEVKEVLGEEYCAFLDSIGVEIIDGNLQVETVEQFKAIGEYFNDKMAKMNYVELNIFPHMFVMNFNSMSPQFRQQLIDDNIVVKASDEWIYFGDFSEVYLSILDNELGRIGIGEDRNTFFKPFAMCFEGSTIINMNKLWNYTFDAYDAYAKGDFKTYSKYLTDYANYYLDWENNFPGVDSITTLLPSSYQTIEFLSAYTCVLASMMSEPLPKEYEYFMTTTGIVKYYELSSKYFKDVFAQYREMSKAKTKTR